MDDIGIEQEMNDTTIRLIFIPFFGFIIPNVTGMIDNGAYSAGPLVLHYLYFIFISFAIWHGNRYLLFRLRPRFSWLNQPVRKVIALVVSNVFYTIPVAVGLLVLWYSFTGRPNADWTAVFEATTLCVVCVVFITHTYETVFLIRSWETDKVRGEQLERARIEAELQALRSQLDPHFIFNSLNTLSHLIEQDPGKARQFNDHLADVYRYLLTNRDRSLVLLREEREFLVSYFALLRIRFGSAIDLQFNVPSEELDRVLLAPISLQVLAENAVKHNEFTEDDPMTLDVALVGDALIVRNRLRPRHGVRPSARVGLRNLNERCRLLTGRGLDSGATDGTFTVTLPILKASA